MSPQAHVALFALCLLAACAVAGLLVGWLGIARDKRGRRP